MNALQQSKLRTRLEELKSRLEPEVAGLANEAFRPTAGLATLGADMQADPGASAAEEETARTLYGAESATLAEIDAAWNASTKTVTANVRLVAIRSPTRVSRLCPMSADA
jgi:hypothetical protein